ncbi:protein kinase [Amycolatopsis sp. DG1A-15b]|uniref:protein kinase domain-containing protein n=1 Tax=Amycolatopsis sp. DG1A-15b TaxID=3052846 RepID=UPI00255B4170|nr:protein kinase [Amycolatopsis sp. DG1A-15b]WIX92522.1 protein kinase [Amycolatopsis sp. DG1A-15b]
MTEPSPTRRDPPHGAAPTRRDDVVAPAVTRRDGAESSPAARPEVDHGGLPGPVFEEYEPLEALKSGGEAHRVMKVRHRRDGTFHVVKVYGEAVRPDPELLASLQAADTAHLVRIDGWGADTDRYGHSECWEILEFVPGGSLRDLIRAEGPAIPEALVRRVLRQLTGALEHLHTAVPYRGSAGLAHRDVKPENILVRNRAELDLVLCDFGLVADIRATRMSSRRAGTAAYQAPETWQTRSRDAAQDWWSVGVLIVELLTGRNPNTGIMGDSPDDADLFDHLTQYGVDLSEVTDPRWRMLCAGLLTFATSHRWGAEQVRNWDVGKSPDVHSGRDERQPARPAVLPIEVAGRACHDPAEVASVFSQNWQAATRQFADRELRLELSYWLDDNFADASLPKDLFRTDPSTMEVASLRVARFISWTAPDLVPSRQGHPMHATGIAALADRAAAGDDVAAVARLDSAWLGTFARHTCRVHRACGAGDGCVVLRSAAGLIDAAREVVNERAGLLGRVRLGDRELATAQARLVQVLVDRDYRESVRLGDPALRQVGWWGGLMSEGAADDDRGMGALALAVATKERAYLDMGAAAAERKQRRQEERNRRRQSVRAALGRVAPVGRDLLALALVLVLAYLTTFVALLLVARLAEEWVSGPAAIAAAFTGVQTRIALPVAVLLACVLVRPRRPRSVGRRAVWCALGLGGLVAMVLGAGRLDLLGFPVVWSAGVQEGLSAANGALVGAADTLPATTIVAVIAGLILANRLVAVTRGARASASRPVQAGKGLLMAVVVGIILVRTGVLLWQWQLPPAAPDPLALWLEI